MVASNIHHRMRDKCEKTHVSLKDQLWTQTSLEFSLLNSEEYEFWTTRNKYDVTHIIAVYFEIK